MADLPARRDSWLTRTASVMRGWFSAPTKAPPVPGAPGVTVSRQLASAPDAESDLESLSRSPTVYAALTGQALSAATYPIRIYRGWSIAGTRMEPIDPDETEATRRWAVPLILLLHRPEPADTPRTMFPRPGEGLIAQLWADLSATGNFWVRPTLDAQGWPIGLTRLHPALCTLEMRAGILTVRYRVPNGGSEYYPYDEIAHGRLLSWEKSGQGLMGTGAGASLAPIVEAERIALEQTATTIGQGGGQILISAANDAGSAFLADKRHREEVADEVSSRLGKRVIAVGPALKAEASGWKPGDMLAPELMASAPTSELMALGVVPMIAGHDSGTYATAAQQYRVQATRDEGLAMVIEAYLLRPLAQYFARRAGVRENVERITCKIDLSGHPGYTYIRTDAVNRMQRWVAMGWTAEQAAEIEGMDVPRPMGTPAPTSAPDIIPNGTEIPADQPGPRPGQPKTTPRRPVGDQGDPLPNK